VVMVLAPTRTSGAGSLRSYQSPMALR